MGYVICEGSIRKNAIALKNTGEEAGGSEGRRRLEARTGEGRGRGEISGREEKEGGRRRGKEFKEERRDKIEGRVHVHVHVSLRLRGRKGEEGWGKERQKERDGSVQYLGLERLLEKGIYNPLVVVDPKIVRCFSQINQPAPGKCQ